MDFEEILEFSLAEIISGGMPRGIEFIP